jgi:Flp pilus assembly protein TadG
MNTMICSSMSPDARRRRGAIVPLFAIMLPVIMLFAGFGLYIAWSQLVRTELRTATDFAARAGATRLSMDQKRSSARRAAIDAASRNTVGGAPLVLTRRQIEFGVSQQRDGDGGRFFFTPERGRVNGVRVAGGFEGTDATTTALANLSGLNSRAFSRTSVATNLDRDICVVIDRSGSMSSPVNSTFNGTTQECGPLPVGCRFAALADAVDVFIEELESTPQRELVSLASYSSRINIRCTCCKPEITTRIQFPEALLHSGLSDNTFSLRAPIRSMLLLGIGGSTAIGSGLRVGIDAVKGPGARPFAAPTILLMTDGNHNLGVSPEVVAHEAAAANIVVHTITFSRGADRDLMRRVAQITGGKHLHADTAEDLTESFREIAQTLPVMLTE